MKVSQVDMQRMGNDMLKQLYRMFDIVRKPVTDRKLRKRLHLRHKALSLVMSDRFMNGRL